MQLVSDQIEEAAVGNTALFLSIISTGTMSEKRRARPRGNCGTPVGLEYTVTCTGLDVTVAGVPELSVRLSSNDQVPIGVEPVVEKL